MKIVIKYIILVCVFNYNTNTLCIFNITNILPIKDAVLQIHKNGKIYKEKVLRNNNLGDYITYLPDGYLYMLEVKHQKQAIIPYMDTIDLRYKSSNILYKNLNFPLVEQPALVDMYATIIFQPHTINIDSNQTNIEILPEFVKYLNEENDVHTLIKIHTSPNEDLHQELADMRLHMIQKLFKNSKLVGFSSIISSSETPQVAFHFGNFTYFLREAEAKPCFILVKTDQSKDIEISQAQPLKVNFYPKTFYNYYDGWHIYKLLSGCSYKVSIDDKVFEYDFTNVTKDTVVSIFP